MIDAQETPRLSQKVLTDFSTSWSRWRSELGLLYLQFKIKHVLFHLVWQQGIRLIDLLWEEISVNIRKDMSSHAHFSSIACTYKNCFIKIEGKYMTRQDEMNME